MTRLLLLSVLALSTAFALPACKKDSKNSKESATTSNSQSKTVSAAPRASQPITKPGDVVATLQFPTGDKLVSLASAMDNIQPGASSMAVSGLPMALRQVSGVDFSGADLSQSISIVLLSPKKYDKPAAILVTPSDLSALEASAKSAGMTLQSKNGLALVGEASAVQAASEAAFGSLSQPAKEMVVRVYPSTLITAYKDDLHAAVAQMGTVMSSEKSGKSGFQTMMVAYEEMVLAMGDQTEYLEMRVGTGDGVSDLLVRLQPRANTTMAALAAAQVPSKHALLAKLPASSSGTMLFSGEMRAGAALGPMIDFSLKIMESIMPAQGDTDLRALFAAWFEALDGQLAMNMTMDMSNPLSPKVDATYLMGAESSDGIRKGWRDMFKLMVANSKNGTLANTSALDMMGMKFEVDYKVKALEVDGVEVDRYTSKMKFDAMSAEDRKAMGDVKFDQTMHFAAFDKMAVMAMSDDSAKSVEHAISAARGKAPGYQPGGAIAKAIKRSVDRKESMLMTMDFASLVPVGAATIPFSLLTMGFGQDEGAMVFRLSVRK